MLSSAASLPWGLNGRRPSLHPAVLNGEQRRQTAGRLLFPGPYSLLRPGSDPASGISEGMVKSHTSRGMAALRAELAHEQESRL